MYYVSDGVMGLYLTTCEKNHVLLVYVNKGNKAGWPKKKATIGIGWGYYSKKYATTLILLRWVHFCN